MPTFHIIGSIAAPNASQGDPTQAQVVSSTNCDFSETIIAISWRLWRYMSKHRHHSSSPHSSLHDLRYHVCGNCLPVSAAAFPPQKQAVASTNKARNTIANIGNATDKLGKLYRTTRITNVKQERVKQYSKQALTPAPDLGGARSPGPGSPTKQGPPTMFMGIAICTTCVCN